MLASIATLYVSPTANAASTLKLIPPLPAAMDLCSARALMMTSKNSSEVVQAMLALFKEETKTFGSMFHLNVPDVPASPARRCCMRRGAGRCRGVVSELAATQVCAFHQARNKGDLNLDATRRLSTVAPEAFNQIFRSGIVPNLDGMRAVALDLLDQIYHNGTWGDNNFVQNIAANMVRREIHERPMRRRYQMRV